MQPLTPETRTWLLSALLTAAGFVGSAADAVAESRITALPARSDTRPAASARLRIEVIVPPVLVLNTVSTPTASSHPRVWTNGGAFTTHCASGTGAGCTAPTVAQP